MNLSIKEHISLITALFAILFTLQVYFIIERTIVIYEETLRTSYSMIVVSSKNLKIDLVKDEIQEISKIEKINPRKVINRIKTELNKEDVSMLKDHLPNFYRIFFQHYPSPETLESLKLRVQQIDGVIRVETYSKTHNQIFKLLILFKDISNIFLIVIFLVSTMLVIKEMRIWQFEHTDRMYIMALFGAPLWMRSAVLFKVAVMDSFVSSIIVVITFMFLSMNGWLHELFSMISVEVNIFRVFEDSFRLIIISFIISFVLAMVTILRKTEQNLS
jgi:cell division transport system permease protein